MNEFKHYSLQYYGNSSYLHIKDQTSDGFSCNSKGYTSGVNSPKGELMKIR